MFFLHGFILEIKEKREKKKRTRERRKLWILLAGSLNANVFVTLFIDSFAFKDLRKIVIRVIVEFIVVPLNI